MAKVTGPLFSSEARGRMGGLVYNTWRGVATVKAKIAPCQPRTSLQLNIRALMVNLSRLWAANVNQAAWNAYAYAHPVVDGMGNSVRSTGANWFCALGLRLLSIGEPIVALPPAIPAPPPVLGLALTPGASQISADWTSPDIDTTSVEIWFDGPHSAGRNGSLAKAKLKVRVLSNAGPSVSTGLLAGTYTVYARSLRRSNGLVSSYVSAICVVT